MKAATAGAENDVPNTGYLSKTMNSPGARKSISRPTELKLWEVPCQV